MRSRLDRARRAGRRLGPAASLGVSSNSASAAPAEAEGSASPSTDSEISVLTSSKSRSAPLTSSSIVELSDGCSG